MKTPRDRILSEAARRHDAHGIDGLSMRGIASGLGLTATSIYRHFHDKQELLDAIVESGFALLVSYLKRTSRAKKPQVLRIIDNFLDFALEQPRLYELMFLRRRDGVRTFPNDFAAHRSTTFDMLRGAVEEEMSAGTMRRDDPLEAALSIWSHAHGLISMYTLGRFGDDAVRFRGIYQRSIRRLYRGLTADVKKRRKR